MKLTKNNADEVWNALLNFLNAEDIVIDDNGDLCTVDHGDDEYCYSIQLSDGRYVPVDNISLDAYENANWGIVGESMTIDEFAYHLKQNAFDVKNRILMQLLKFLKKGIIINYDNNPSAFFKANSLEEIFISNDIKVKADLKT